MTREATGTLLSCRSGIKVIDATLRDGGLVNDFRFSDDFVRALFAANAAAGVDYMELGYKADKDLFDESKFGKWKFCREADIIDVLGNNETEMKLACMADVGRCNFRRDICEKGNSPLDMYRVATYINTIPAAKRGAANGHFLSPKAVTAKKRERTLSGPLPFFLWFSRSRGDGRTRPCSPGWGLSCTGAPPPA